MTHAEHTIAPVFNAHSSILILGSFPSVKSREGCFFYHHPQNRFWKVLAAVFSSPPPATIEEKKTFLLDRRIALWDVIQSCDIQASSDSSIANVIPNDISAILNATAIRRIYTNGNTAFALYNRYIYPKNRISAVKLPSTSPANARFTLDMLIREWMILLDAENKI